MKSRALPVPWCGRPGTGVVFLVAAKMGAGTACGGSPEAVRRTRELWTAFGFAEALAEVAHAGRRQDAVAEFLARCGTLRDDKAKGAQTKAPPR